MALSRRSFYPFIVPVMILIASAVLIWYWPGWIRKANAVKEIHALLVVLPLMPYVIGLVIGLMGWRYHNAGLILTALALVLCYAVLSRSPLVLPGRKWPAFSFFDAAGLLFPLNLALFSLMTKRRILTGAFAACLAGLFVQVLLALVLCRWPGPTGSALPGALQPHFPRLAALSGRMGAFLHDGSPTLFHLSVPVLIVFAAVFIFLAVRFLLSRDTLCAGFIGTLTAVFLAFTAGQRHPSDMIYFSAAGLILIVGAIEASFFMAYVDELTGLPGRRALNETLLNLGSKYAIAMIDVDHFKKFNDTYGHKTGDQVLKMIAVHLAGISGGAKTFRYGGEEFTAVFPGKFAWEVQPYLENYRQIIAATPFTVRSKQRRKGRPENRGRQSVTVQKKVQVTVSIGAASPDKQRSTPETVLKAADQILYKAKKAGRNRVMT